MMLRYSTQESLMELANDKAFTVEERAKALLDIGLNELNLELGIISKVVNNKYTVIHTNNPDLLGQEFDLGVTYCGITLSLVSNGIFAVKHFAVSDYLRHPAYKAFKLETYIGAPIILRGRPYGTLNFTKSEPNEREFTTEEKNLVKALSNAVAVLIREQQFSRS